VYPLGSMLWQPPRVGRGARQTTRGRGLRIKGKSLGPGPGTGVLVEGNERTGSRCELTNGRDSKVSPGHDTAWVSHKGIRGWGTRKGIISITPGRAMDVHHSARWDNERGRNRDALIRHRAVQGGGSDSELPGTPLRGQVVKSIRCGVPGHPTDGRTAVGQKFFRGWLRQPG